MKTLSGEEVALKAQLRGYGAIFKTISQTPLIAQNARSVIIGVQKGNDDMNQSKIEWCDSTWNPVTGCLHGCEYCYARKIANRFGREVLDRAEESKNGLHCVYNKVESNPYPYLFEPTLHAYRFDEPQRKTKPRTIFVCSMADLFGEWVPDEWIEEVFAACDKAPQHRYLFLTKNPQRYLKLGEAGKLPKRPNMWYGSTVTSSDMEYFYSNFHNVFLSIEPLLAEYPKVTRPKNIGLNWIIIGAETGNRKDKVVPEKAWIDNICESADEIGIPVFMKDSLIPIVGEENMRREFP